MLGAAWCLVLVWCLVWCSVLAWCLVLGAGLVLVFDGVLVLLGVGVWELNPLLWASPILGVLVHGAPWCLVLLVLVLVWCIYM